MLAASTITLGAWYLFTMLRRLLFGVVREPVLRVARPDVQMISPIADLARTRAATPASPGATARLAE